MSNQTEIMCACGCGRKKMVRTADVKRGWGKFYSKSCKAKSQERRTGQNAAYQARQQERFDGWESDALDTMESGWDGHKVWTS